MGNKIGKRRQAVDEKYTRPQGLYLHRDIDHKKLRKLILDCKLAPCYPGNDECIPNKEECPICFLFYPSLNRSRCCLKGICTECFLQMKPPHSSRPTQCPYCKTPNYAVEYRGERTREERGLEQIEEQKVIEAQIRVRHQEIQNEQERMKRWQEISSSEVEHNDNINASLSVRYLMHSVSLQRKLCPHQVGPAQLEPVTSWPRHFWSLSSPIYFRMENAVQTDEWLDFIQELMAGIHLLLKL